MQSWRKRILLVMLAFGGVACNTLSRNECVNSDWTLIGFGDGSRGLPVSYVDRHRRSCADYGVKPDLEKYREGHARGMRSYCTISNGVAGGQTGKQYLSGMCPADLEPTFLRGHAHGRRIYEAQSEAERLGNEAQSVERDLTRTAEDIKGIEAKLIATAGTTDERAKWVNQLRALGAKRDELSYRLQGLRDAEAAQFRLAGALRTEAQTLR